MTVKEIVYDWLKAHGYTGLYDADGGECGCEIDDLMPADNEACLDCEPGYRVMCTPECAESHEYEPENGYAWHIQPEKAEGDGGKDHQRADRSTM